MYWVSIKYSSSFTVHVVSGSSAEKTKAGQKIKGLRILLKPHVLYGWLLLVIGLMHGIMQVRTRDDQWQAGMDGIACSASCGLPEKPDEKICLDVSAQILICCFCSRNRISYCVCSDILKLQFFVSSL